MILKGGDESQVDIPDWMRDASEQQQAEERLHSEAQRAERLQKAKAKLSQKRGIFGAQQTNDSASKAGTPDARRNKQVTGTPDDGQPVLDKHEQEFLLEEWDSDAEHGGYKRKAPK